MREARYVSLIPRSTLHSDSEQFIYNWNLEDNLDLDKGNWRKLNGMYIMIACNCLNDCQSIYVRMIIVLCLNVVNNLNFVLVINKPCMREARYVSLIPRTTLHSDSEQFLKKKRKISCDYLIDDCSSCIHSVLFIASTCKLVGRCVQLWSRAYDSAYTNIRTYITLHMLYTHTQMHYVPSTDMRSENMNKNWTLSSYYECTSFKTHPLCVPSRIQT